MREHLAIVLCLEMMSEYEEFAEAFDLNPDLNSITVENIKPLDIDKSVAESHRNIVSGFKTHYQHTKEFRYGNY